MHSKHWTLVRSSKQSNGKLRHIGEEKVKLRKSNFPNAMAHFPRSLTSDDWRYFVSDVSLCSVIRALWLPPLASVSYLYRYHLCHFLSRFQIHTTHKTAPINFYFILRLYNLCDATRFSILINVKQQSLSALCIIIYCHRPEHRDLCKHITCSIIHKFIYFQSNCNRNWWWKRNASPVIILVHTTLSVFFTLSRRQYFIESKRALAADSGVY